jgi:hypothetical protein
VSPDGDSVLVAEFFNNRVQQVRIIKEEESSFVRLLGERVLKQPQFVDCNNDCIVVSEWGCSRVSVLSWATGDLISQFGSKGRGPGQMFFPLSVRLLKGREPAVVVADFENNRLCMFKVNGEFVAAVGSEEQGLCGPSDVLPCKNGFIVANYYSHQVIKLSRDGIIAGVYGKKGGGNGEFNRPTALAALPDGGLVVQEYDGMRFQVFHDLAFRITWIAVCL